MDAETAEKLRAMGERFADLVTDSDLMRCYLLLSVEPSTDAHIMGRAILRELARRQVEETRENPTEFNLLVCKMVGLEHNDA